MDFDPRGFNDSRDIDHQCIYGLSQGEDERERHERELLDPDLRDAFVRRVDLPRGLERELVQGSRDRLYELNGDERRMLAAVGAFRVVSEHELDAFRGRDSLGHLRDGELIRSVPGHNEEVVVLTDRGWDVLDAHRLDRDDTHRVTPWAVYAPSGHHVIDGGAVLDAVKASALRADR